MAALPTSWSAPFADELFGEPYIDIDERRDTPIAHRYVHGGFANTDTRYSFYFPETDRYQGRFFQHVTPVPDSEHLAQEAVGEEDRISFAASSGGYFVETNGGGTWAGPGQAGDASVGAYRANAACAQWSRHIAAAVYGPGRVYGYLFGGSGGGFRTIGSMENTEGVWDGSVPYVIGSPAAMPNVFTVRMRALRVLRSVFPAIVDAYDAGGPCSVADLGLTGEQRSVFDEVTRMGFPPKSWYGHRTMGPHAFSLLFQGVRFVDPAYFTEFWTTPGYLGHDDPASLAGDRISHTTAVVAVLSRADVASLGVNSGRMPGMPKGGVDTAWDADSPEGQVPVAVRVTALPPGDLDYTLADLVVESGSSAGARFVVRSCADDVLLLNDADPALLSRLAAGDSIRIENADFLAVQTYHRHQDPGDGYPVWDQFRTSDGVPVYPQRPILLGPLFTQGASGSVPTGRFTGKMIVVASLHDREALPWQADWYRRAADSHFGESSDERFRLWFTDNALHGDSAAPTQEHPTRSVGYLGALHQALRDVAAWVEDGVVPPRSSEYAVVDGQVVLSRPEMGGVQPTGTLTANGGSVALVSVGDAVTFAVSVRVPEECGTVVAVEWSCDGTDQFEPDSIDPRLAHGAASRTYTYNAPGTYFPTVRFTSARSGVEPFGQVQNLARARVVVRPVANG